MTQQSSLFPDCQIGVTRNGLYVLAATDSLPDLCITARQRDPLPLHRLQDRAAFLLQALQGCNLLKNADFSGDGQQPLAGWIGAAETPASVGVDFSEKWRLQNGHTAFLFAPHDAPRPVLQTADAAPLIAAGNALPYRLSGLFATHRADGWLNVDYLSATGVKLGGDTLRIAHSSRHLGGNHVENYRYLQWQLEPAPDATHVSLRITMGPCTDIGASNSFLFIAHLFLGVADRQDPLIWAPYSAGADALTRYAQNPAWRSFGWVALPADNPDITVDLAGRRHGFTPESAAIPDYLGHATIHTSEQALGKLFDPLFYAQSDPQTLACLDNDALFAHYQTTGSRRNLAPTPYFDIAWYRVNNPELQQQDIDPVTHFIDTGSALRRAPHPLFDAEYYYRRYLADTHPKAEPLFHYLAEGWKRGYQPHPLFWPRWYAARYLKDHAGDIDPFQHFLTEGWRQQCNPNPLFDVKHYIKEYGAKNRLEPDPLSHYVHVGWREHYQPHRLFDANYYAQQSGFNGQTAKRSPLEAFFADNDPGISPHPLFDADFYREQLGREPAQHPLLDYLERGWRGNIDPHPLFSKAYYYQHAKDAVIEQTDALIHYLEQGWRQKLAVHPLFDAPFYLEQNPKAQGCIPLQHYLVHGWRNGFSGRPPVDKKDLADAHKQPPAPKAITTLAMPTDRLFAPLNATFNSARIGVFAHIFYPDLADEMVTASNRIPGCCTLYISTDQLDKARRIDAVCRELSAHPFEIRVTPNRGRDIAPMVAGFRDRLQQVDYGVHIHSKRSNHFDAEFANGWRRHLLAGNLGSTALVTNILNLLADDAIGVYAPDHYDAIRPVVEWTGNFDTIKILLQLSGETLSKDHALDFPSGSMFWFKTQALKPLLDLNLRPYHFEAEQGQTDNTLAHALERCFYYFAELSGYAWIVGKPVSGDKAAQAVAAFHAAGGRAPLFANRLFPTHRELGGLRRYFSQCTRFLVRPSRIDKPRLNLLIPSLIQGQVQIDSHAPLAQFAAIRRALGDRYDARIITTDVSPDALLNPPEGYRLWPPSQKDRADRDVVTDAAQRFRYPFIVRDADIFVATAWWTARHALDIMAQQDALFGAKPRRFVYLIQDNEVSHCASSCLAELAEQTYRHAEQAIPVFTTEGVFDYFRQRGYFSRGHVAYPVISSGFKAAIRRGTPKEKIVLLAVRPHIDRYGLPFLDLLVQTLIDRDAEFWSDWRFCALGNHLQQHTFKISTHVEVLNALPSQDYAELASSAALGIALLTSLQPNQFALEMAAAGVSVLTNNQAAAQCHDNIRAFDGFDAESVAQQFQAMAERWLAQPASGWQGQPKADWFYGDADHLSEVAAAVVRDLMDKPA